jgi:hypothetical protein
MQIWNNTYNETGSNISKCNSDSKYVCVFMFVHTYELLWTFIEHPKLI